MKKLLLLTLGILASLQVSYGAIAFNSSSTGYGFPVSSLTVSHTTSGSDRALFCSADVNTGATISTVTYAGTAMLKVSAGITDAAGPVTYMYYLLNPTSGANNVVVTPSGSTAITLDCFSYTGVDQTSLDATTTVAGATTGSYSQTITTVADNSWIIATSRAGSGLTLTAGANTHILRQPHDALGGGGTWDTNSAQTPAGSKTMTVTSGSQLFGGAIVASFKPSGGAPASTPTYYGAVKFMRHR